MTNLESEIKVTTNDTYSAQITIFNIYFQLDLF
jgi:hypothetical protein